MLSSGALQEGLNMKKMIFATSFQKIKKIFINIIRRKFN